MTVFLLETVSVDVVLGSAGGFFPKMNNAYVKMILR